MAISKALDGALPPVLSSSVSQAICLGALLLKITERASCVGKAGPRNEITLFFVGPGSFKKLVHRGPRSVNVAIIKRA